MSTFVLKKEYALQLPSSYVDIDREEMEYIDGGWNFTTFRNNIVGLAATCTAAAVIVNKFIKPVLLNNRAFAAIMAKISPYLAKVGSLFGGWIGLVVFSAGATAAGWYLGNNRVFY